MKIFDDDIGAKIAVLRKANNVNAQELSIALGKKSDYIYRLEKGYFKPSTAPFLMICRQLDISPMIVINSSLEVLEKIVAVAKKIEELEKEQREAVMEKLFSLVEEKMSEALENE